MNDSNETQYGECSQSAPFVESISIKVILILEILIGLSSSISNSLLIVAVWRVSVFHANLRWLLINLSLNLFWYASAITMKAAYLLSITLLGDPCLLMIDSIICKRWELLYVTPFLNTVYSLISVGVERLFSTIRYRSYDRSSRIPWLACVFIPAIWVGTLANQLAVLSSLRSQTLPICLSFIFVKFSVVRATILANSTMEIIAVMLISILHVWNLHKRDRAVNAAWIKHGYSLASRFQIIQNVDINKLLLPSVISHATAHMLYMAFLTVLLLGTELSLKIKVILIHCSFVWFTAYGTTHALLAFSRHPQLKQTLAKWAPSALRNVLNRKRKKVEAHHFSTSANLHFEMLSKMWAINEPNGVNANIAASKSPALKVMFANRSTSPAVRINTES